ncbi:MAG: protease complex subunit PrcB family protein [Thermotogae bacterium]|nr:protease complex subunit PrcB family protein [Thermotogota bacterium]
MMLLLLTMGKSNPVAWEKVAEGPMSGVNEAKAVWYDSTYSNLLKADGKEPILLIFLGRRSTGGYSVEVEEIKTDGKKLVVVAKEICPKPGSMVIQVITTPFVAVRVEIPQRLPVELKLKKCKR